MLAYLISYHSNFDAILIWIIVEKKKRGEKSGKNVFETKTFNAALCDHG
jgi:hypothetical protein